MSEESSPRGQQPMPVAPVLDYASPRPRGKLRLAATSVLFIDESPGQLLVTERLKGRVGAMVAITFSVLTLLWFARVTGTLLHGWGGPMLEHPMVVGILILFVADAVLIPLVINATWRRTVLLVQPSMIELTFFAALVTPQEYRWPAGSIEAIAVTPTARPEQVAERVPLAELEIRTRDGMVVRLFTDHGQEEVEQIAAAMRRVLA